MEGGKRKEKEAEPEEAANQQKTTEQEEKGKEQESYTDWEQQKKQRIEVGNVTYPLGRFRQLAIYLFDWKVHNEENAQLKEEKVQGKFAFVTLLTSMDYFDGVVALIRSLRYVSHKPLVVIVTDDIPREKQQYLQELAANIDVRLQNTHVR